jgi:hypothetical protein
MGARIGKTRFRRGSYGLKRLFRPAFLLRRRLREGVQRIVRQAHDGARRRTVQRLRRRLRLPRRRLREGVQRIVRQAHDGARRHASSPPSPPPAPRNATALHRLRRFPAISFESIAAPNQCDVIGGAQMSTVVREPSAIAIRRRLSIGAFNP